MQKSQQFTRVKDLPVIRESEVNSFIKSNTELQEKDDDNWEKTDLFYDDNTDLKCIIQEVITCEDGKESLERNIIRRVIRR